MASSSQSNGPHPRQTDDLLTNQKLLRATLDSSTDMIQVFEAVRDEQGEIVDFTGLLNNHASETMYGDVLGKSLLQQQPGVVEEGIFEAFKQVVETGLPRQYEKPYVREQFDGWFHQLVVRLNDGVVTTTADITARKKAEQEIREQAHFIRSVTGTALAIISITEFPSGATIFFNRDPYLKLGFDVDELVQMKREDRLRLVHPDDVPKLRDYYTQFATLDDADEVRIEYRLKNREGDWVWLDSRSKVFKRDEKGNVLQLLHVAQDSTGKKLAEREVVHLKEEAAQKATDQYLTLFNSIYQGFALCELVRDENGRSVDHRILELNPAFEQQTGIPRQTLLGRMARDVFPTLDHWWTEIYTALVDSGKSTSFERYFEEIQRWYEIGAYPMQGDQFAVFYNDITERKQRERSRELLISITQDLGQLSDETEIVHAVGTKLAAYLGITCYHYVDIEEDRDQVTVRHFWHALDVPPILGTYPLRAFVSPTALTAWRAGKPTIVNDIEREVPDGTPEAAVLKAGAAAQQIRAFIAVGLSQEGKWKAYFSLADSRPRQWTDVEIDLVQQVAGQLLPRIERARAEEALRASEEKYRTLFTSIDEGFVIQELIYDEAGKPVDVRLEEANPAHEKQTGLKNVIGKTSRELGMATEDHWFEMYDYVIKTGEPLRFINGHAPTHRWYDVFLSRIGGGSSTRMAMVFNDITERKRNEQRQAFLLQLSDALRPLMDAAAIRYTAVQVLGRHLGANRVAYAENVDGELFEVKQNYVDGLPEVVGRYPYADYGPDIVSMLQEGKNRVQPDVANDETLTAGEKAALAANGVGASLNVPLVKKGRLVAFMGINFSQAHDFTPDEISLVEDVAERTWAVIERANVEEALSASQKRFESIANLVPDLLWDGQPDGSTNWYNQRWLDYTGQRFEEAIGWGWMEAIHPDERAGSARRYGEAVKTGTLLRQEHRIRRHDGVYRWFVVSAAPFKDENGDVIKMYGAATDIHDLKRLETRLLEADRRKDEFLAMLAHELRNPLSTLRSGLTILGLSTTDGPAVASTVTMMERQTHHLVRMVDDLLDVSRISRGRIELKTERVDLVEVVSQAVKSVESLYREQGKSLQVDLPTAPIYLEGDATRLTQVVANLLTNGVRYTGEHGQVWLSLSHPHAEAVLQVRDNGIGLAEDQLSAIFELFVQVDNSTARSRGGLGLGLTLVKRLVEMHGGEVTVQSQGLGAGSTFTVHLPTLAHAAAPTPEPALQAPDSATAQRMLVIDDNADAAFTLGMLLKLKGYESYTRNSGRAGIEAAEALRPSAILLDIGMPELDGYATCRLIREQPWGQAMTIVALTGYGQEEDRQRTSEVGFDGHLVKPVDITVLTSLIADLLEKRKG